MERAARLAPRQAEIQVRLAEMYFQLGRAREAREAYRRVVELNPADAISHNNLAVLLFRAGEIAGARRHLDRARELGLQPAPGFLEALAAAEREGR
jgi:Flp pilus assembly protein TadD